MEKPRKGYNIVKVLFDKEIEIPEEWKIKTINDTFKILHSGTNPRSDLNENGYFQYIHYGDIHKKWTNIILDCDVEYIPHIDKEKVVHLPLLKEGDLIIADVSEDYEGSGTSCLLKNVKNKKIVSGLHTIVLRSKDDDVSSDFVNYLTSIIHVKLQIIHYVTGTSVYGLSKTSLKAIKVPFPTLSEQQKIASILSKIDALIESTQKVIEKTDRLKMGLMQELLTRGIGHTKFKKIILGDIVNFSSGEFLPKKNHNYGNIPIYGGNGITGYHDEELIKYNTIIFGRVGAYCGSVHMSRCGSWITDNAIYVKNISNQIKLEYLYLFLSRLNIGLLSEISAQPKISQGILTRIKIQFPENLLEQQKIASILSGVDAYIQKNQEYKKKVQILKKGLMQKLLTGQIRV